MVMFSGLWLKMVDEIRLPHIWPEDAEFYYTSDLKVHISRKLE